MFAGCGGSDDNVPTYGNVTQDNNPHGAPPHVQAPPVGNQPENNPATTPPPTDNAPTTTPAPEATPTPTPEPTSQWNHAFTGITAFSEGLAWVAYDEGASVIDTHGNVVFSVEGSIVHFAPFEDGTSFYITGRHASDVDGFEFFIVDRTGRVTLSNQDQPHALYIATMGGGMFVLLEHEVSFAVNEWRIRATDRYGNNIIPPQVILATSAQSFLQNFGSHLYLGYGAFFLSVNTGHYIFDVVEQHLGTSRHTVLASVLHDREYLAIRTDGNRRNLHRHFYDGARIMYRTILTEFREGIAGVRSHSDLITSPRGTTGSPGSHSITNMIRYSEGLIWVDISRTERGYANWNGEIIVEFPQFDGMRMYGSPFDNGYAALYILGADGNLHVTIINRNGDVLHDPMPVAGANAKIREGYMVFWTEADNERAFHLMTADGTIREIARFAGTHHTLFDVREGFVIVGSHGHSRNNVSDFIFICIETGLQIGTFD